MSEQGRRAEFTRSELSRTKKDAVLAIQCPALYTCPARMPVWILLVVVKKPPKRREASLARFEVMVHHRPAHSAAPLLYLCLQTTPMQKKAVQNVSLYKLGQAPITQNMWEYSRTYLPLRTMCVKPMLIGCESGKKKRFWPDAIYDSNLEYTLRTPSHAIECLTPEHLNPPPPSSMGHTYYYVVVS